MSLTTSQSLIHALQGGDEAAWTRFVRLYNPLVYRWCRSSGLQPADAADVGSEVFKSVFRSIRDFRPGGFRAWLKTITINKLRDGARKAARAPIAVGGSSAHRRARELPDEFAETVLADSSDSVAVPGDDAGMLYRRAAELVCETFPEYYWPVFCRYVIDDREARAVAQEHAVTIAAVYNVKRRVIKRLKIEFQGLLD